MVEFSSILASLLFASLVSAELSVNTTQGKVTFDDKGRWSLRNSSGTTIYKGEVGFFTPGWGPRNQSQLNIISKPDATQQLPLVWKGTFKENGANCNFTQTVSLEEQEIKLSYVLESEEGFKIEKGSQYPFLRVLLTKDQFNGSKIRIGSKTVSLPNNNVWGTGNKLHLYQSKTLLSFSDTINQSVWSNKRTGGWNVRVFMAGDRVGSDGSISGTYKLSFTIGTSKSQETITPTVSDADRITEHIKDYERMLELSGLPDVSYKQGKNLLVQSAEHLKNGNTRSAKQYENKFASWAALLSQAYDLHSQLYHLEIFSSFSGYKVHPNLKKSYKELVHELNSSEDAAKGNLIAGQTRILFSETEKDIIDKYGYSFFPASQYNPANWVKAFSITGYTRDKENLVRREPFPWDIKFKNGVSFALLDSLPAMDKYFAERSWVTTSWQGEKGRFTFSMLTPLILCDDIPKLKLSNLSSSIESITFQNKDNKSITVLPNNFDQLKTMGKSYLWLKGKNLSILVFLHETPKSVVSDKSSIEFDFGQKTKASILVISSELKAQNIFAEAEFWSKVSVCPPVQVVESFKNNEVTYNYIFKESANDSWNTPPLKISPVPHLRVLAEGTDHFKTRHISSDYGKYSYQEASSLSFKLPLQKQDALEGINAYTTELKDDNCKKLSEENCKWVRVILGPRWNKDIEGGYESLEQALTNMDKYNLKALIDPHDFVFMVNNKIGIPTDKVAVDTFVELWQRLAEISIKHPNTVIGYDLYNELRVFNINAWPQWYTLAETVIKKIRTIDAKTPIYLSAIDMSNASGYINAEPFTADTNLVYSFHFYAPHGFTHQKHTNGFADPDVFYPGWLPVIQWSPLKLYGPQPLVWWDRWTIGASMLPVLEFQVKNSVMFHCGEIAPIGYTKGRLGESAGLWTRDSLNWLKTYNVSWHLWNQGYGMSIPQVKELILERWSNQ